MPTSVQVYEGNGEPPRERAVEMEILCFTWNQHLTKPSVAFTFRDHAHAVELIERLTPLLERLVRARLHSEYLVGMGVDERVYLDGWLTDIRVRHTDETHTVYVDWRPLERAS